MLAADRKGMSAIELIIAVAITAILAAVAIFLLISEYLYRYIVVISPASFCNSRRTRNA